MFKNREILLEVEYLKQLCERMESLLKLSCTNESRLEEKLDDIKKTLVNVTSKTVMDEFDHLTSAMKCLKESIFECQKMMIEDKVNKPLNDKQKKNTKIRTTGARGTK